MRLEPKLQEVPALGQSGYDDNVIIYAHYFSKANQWDWYLMEYDPEEKLAYGFVQGVEDEFGYFSIAELEAVNKTFGFDFIELDEAWAPCTLHEAIEMGGK